MLKLPPLTVMGSVRTLCLPALLVVSSACSSMDRVSAVVMRPAEADLAQYELIAVDKFEGEAYDLMGSEVATAMRSARNPLTGDLAFELMERRELDEMLERVAGRPGAEWDTNVEQTMERWRRASLILRGRVLVHELESELTQGAVKVGEEKVRTQWVRSATARLSVEIEATDPASGAVMDSVRYDEEVRDAVASFDRAPSPLDGEHLLGLARNQVTQRYLNRVLPHEVRINVSLFSDGDLPDLAIGNGYARTGDWVSALERYEYALGQATGKAESVRYKALFNSGVALQYTREFDSAKANLRDAYALSQKAIILAELERVQEREREHDELLAQSTPDAARGELNRSETQVVSHVTVLRKAPNQTGSQRRQSASISPNPGITVNEMAGDR